MNKFILGLDLGQMHDYTALCIVERIKENEKDALYHLRHLERLKLGTSYIEVVRRVKELMNEELLVNNTHLIVDSTGVGRPVVNLLEQMGLFPIGVTITGSDTVSHEGNYYRVPKRDLVSTLQIVFQSGKLKIAEGLPEARTLVQELLNFKVKITANAHDTYGSGREGIHDDLVLAVSLACWWGQQNVGVIDDMFFDNNKEEPGLYLVDNYPMRREDSWIIADYVRKCTD